jgi:hypothetical protein
MEMKLMTGLGKIEDEDFQAGSESDVAEEYDEVGHVATLGRDVPLTLLCFLEL